MDVVGPADKKILLRVKTHPFDPVVNSFELVVSLGFLIDHGSVTVQYTFTKSDTYRVSFRVKKNGLFRVILVLDFQLD